MSEKSSKEVEDFRQSILSILNRCANRTQILGDNRMHSFIVEDEFDNVVRALELTVDFTEKLREWVVIDLLTTRRHPCSDKELLLTQMLDHAKETMPEHLQSRLKSVLAY